MSLEIFVKPVFVHISKNAGTSIVATAGASIENAGHRTAATWIGAHGSGRIMFAVVRNPFDRVLSEYFFRRRRFLAGEPNPHLSNLGKTFEQWVISTYRDGEYRTKNFFDKSGAVYNPTNMIDNSLIWFVPQVCWILDDDGVSLVDYVLRYERLESDWRNFAVEHQLPQALAHKNASSRSREFAKYYSRQAREIIEEYFARDFDYFGYGFDDLSR